MGAVSPAFCATSVNVENGLATGLAGAAPGFAGAGTGFAAGAAACARRARGTKEDAHNADAVRRSLRRVQGKETGDFVIGSGVLILPSAHLDCQARGTA